MWPDLVPSPARCVGNAVMHGPDTGQLHNWGAVINHKYPGLGSLSLPRNIAQEYGENNTEAHNHRWISLNPRTIIILMFIEIVDRIPLC